jgi:hypothetical protein
MTNHENHKLAKAQAIANEVMNCAAIIVKNAPIAFPPKRLFRKKGKRPLKRLQQQRGNDCISIGTKDGKNAGGHDHRSAYTKILARLYDSRRHSHSRRNRPRTNNNTRWNNRHS